MSLIKENGCIPLPCEALPDSYETIIISLNAAVKKSDLILLSGGSSVGEMDLITKILEKSGKLLFHGIAVKPGKPALGAIVNEKLVIGMPGYPTSCLTNGYGILVPILRKMAGLPEVNKIRLKLPISRRTTSTIGRFQFLPVKIENGYAVPVFKESGAISSMSSADGYVEIPENVDLIEKDEMVEIILFK